MYLVALHGSRQIRQSVIAYVCTKAYLTNEPVRGSGAQDMAFQVTITDRELGIILAALNACTPMGGGSATRSLAQTLGAYTDQSTDTVAAVEVMATVFRHNVVSDYAESCDDVLGPMIQAQMRDWPRTETDV